MMLPNYNFKIPIKLKNNGFNNKYFLNLFKYKYLLTYLNINI